MGQRIKYSHINNIAGVMTTCRKSEHGNIKDQSLKRNNVFEEGQLLISARIKIIDSRIIQTTHNRIPSFKMNIEEQTRNNFIRSDLGL